MQGFTDFLRLFFPSNCLICGKRLGSFGLVLCFKCETHIPILHQGDTSRNPVCQIFWGRIPVQAGTALFRFEKGSAYQSLIHDLKYRGNWRTGVYLGRLLGQKLQHSISSACDLVVPVPLHPRRLRQRGYNQSELIARGISEVLRIPVQRKLIRRIKYQSSQTTMNRMERFQNMEKVFSLCKSNYNLLNRKILLVDDIVTTGATLEACSRLFIEEFNCSIHIATLSHA
jgi:ComF family protein